MSNLYGIIFERVKEDWSKEDKKGSWEDMGLEIERRIKEILVKEWTIGFKDRGLGHGDYGVIVKDTEELIVECGAAPYVAEHIVEVHNKSLGIAPKAKKDNLPDDNEPRLYLLDEGNPETVIPVLTDSPKYIRSDVGSEDHGGMDYEDFARVCDKGEIKQIKSKDDLPEDLLDAFPYNGGGVSCYEYNCDDLCCMMDEHGVVMFPVSMDTEITALHRHLSIRARKALIRYGASKGIARSLTIGDIADIKDSDFDKLSNAGVVTKNEIMVFLDKVKNGTVKNGTR